MRCLESAGIADLSPPDEFQQSDLDHLIATINEDGPFLEFDNDGPRYVATPGSAAFIGCTRLVLDAFP